MDTSKEKEVSLNAVKIATLMALSYGENYGLGIMKISAEKRAKPILNSFNVYPALRWLEQRGLVTMRETETIAERGNRPRLYYKLTEAGWSVLNKAKA
jgi:DNA-binding PadR family transcriptional regulator